MYWLVDLGVWEKELTGGTAAGTAAFWGGTTTTIEEKVANRVTRATLVQPTTDSTTTLQPVLSNPRAHSKITFHKGHGERDMLDCGLKRRGLETPLPRS